ASLLLRAVVLGSATCWSLPPSSWSSSEMTIPSEVDFAVLAPDRLLFDKFCFSDLVAMDGVWSDVADGTDVVALSAPASMFSCSFRFSESILECALVLWLISNALKKNE